ncbi:hypothetical protein HDF23_000864 [Mucilaginibacter lappiensis]|uniref:Uncharacterized protein n=1 Tax=Mucilaginibacter lappiensis TaxID=354630 RepID=A0ABR6PEE5_9SPHI|nr:hypothetical protein [Mucilaginibacter lappiensis]
MQISNVQMIFKPTTHLKFACLIAFHLQICTSEICTFIITQSRFLQKRNLPAAGMSISMSGRRGYH